MFKFLKDRYIKKRPGLILADGIFDFILSIDVRRGTYLRKYEKKNLPFSLQKEGKYDDLLCSLQSRLDGGVLEFSQNMKLIRVLGILTVQEQYSVLCRFKSGENIYYKRILFLYGRQKEIIALCEDITVVLEYREAQRRIDDGPDKRKEELQSLKKRITYLVHEIRSPLNSIYGNLDILQMETCNNNRYLENAILSAEYLLRLVNSALNISAIENNNSIRKAEAVTLEELVKCPKGMFEYEAAMKNIRIYFRFGEPVYRYLYLDRELIQQIMVNLISNAVKYSQEGGEICCRIAQRYLEEKRIRLYLEVADTGIGMEEEFLLKNFSGVWTGQAREYRKDKTPGNGMGLALTKRLVELLHGSIKIESRAGYGTKISVEFDADGDDVLYQERGLSEGGVGKIPEEGIPGIKRALVAEDEDSSMDALCGYLKRLGIASDQTYDGDEAAAVFEQSEEHYYDVVLMDINMPVKSGIEAIRTIRRMERKDNCLPIIAMTADTLAQQKMGEISAQVDGYLIKPYRLEDIRSVLLKYQRR